ncbi:MAG: alkaline phosphatase family protein [Pseudomonadota bacterium]
MGRRTLFVAVVFAAFCCLSLRAQAAEIRDVYVIHFILDGTNLKAFDRALNEGKLPTVKNQFIDGGASFTHALSSFPSTSTTVYQSYATGLLPGNSGIPHLERFDRQKEKVIGYLTVGGHAKVNSDLINLRALTNPDVAEIDPPTAIFELLKGHPTAAIYSSFQRGATYASPKSAPIGALWATYVTGNIEHVNILAMKKVMTLFKGREENIPRYSLVGLYSPDILGHHFGPDSPEVQDSLVGFDLFLKDFLALLEKRGIADKTYIIVSADHGMHESGDIFEFQKSLEEGGVAVKPKDPRAKDYTLYAANRGVVSSHIYVRHDGGFAPLTNPEILRKCPRIGGGTVDLIDLILNLPATDLLIVRAGERRARIFNRDGKRADVACYALDATDYCSYSFDRKSGDPLDYSSDPSLKGLLDGEPHPTRQWLNATAGGHYPDAVTGLSQIFHDGRAGDAFITTRGRWGFRKMKAGNHGGAAEDDMRVPLLISGPDVPRGTFGAARPVDIYPLLLEWFGLNVPGENHDGVDPFAPAKHEDAGWQKIAALEHLFDGRPPLIKMIGVGDFVTKYVHAIVKPDDFPRLRPPAAQESARRGKITLKLRALLAALEKQKADSKAPKVVSKEYLDDHIEIVRRTLKWALEAQHRMEDISAILSQCADAGSSECRKL